MRLKFKPYALHDYRCSVPAPGAPHPNIGGNEYCVRREKPKSWIALVNVKPIGFWSAPNKAEAAARCQAHQDFLEAKEKYLAACQSNGWIP